MMRTPKHLDMHAESLVAIWRAGWGIRHHRTPVGVFIRLEKGVLFRGGRSGWWWRPALTQAIHKAAAEAQGHPLYKAPKLEADW